MLSPADAALVARDPALPGLALLLDGDALSALLGGRVVRRYLRYKAGTSCVLAAVVDGRDVAVTVVAEEGIGKLDKTADRAPRGSVLLDRRGLLVTTPEADRDLPAARQLPHAVARLGLAPGPVQRLSWKPARRYVGRLGDDVVLRLHRTLPPLPAGLPGTSPVLAEHARLGLRALPFVPGRPLDAVLREGAPEHLLHDVGVAVARLHATPCSDLPVLDDGLEEAAAQVGVLLPDLAERAADLAARLHLPRGGTVLHGDLSADQVVVTPEGRVVLLDLDRVRLGAPADDLGSWRAAARLAGHPDDEALLRGYATVLPVPGPEVLALCTAAHLLRRAAEPFRSCRPQWEQQLRRVLRAAEQALAVAA